MSADLATQVGLADRVVALLRYYGVGKRALFVSKICAKAANSPEERLWLSSQSPWNLYHRLCDMGFIHQVGGATSTDWQWSEDRIVFFDENTAMFPEAVAFADGFSQLLEHGLFERRVLYKSRFDREPEIAVHGYVTMRAVEARDVVTREALPIRVDRSVKLIEYLPSAQDIFLRTADLVDSVPESDEFQHRTCAENKWLPSSRPADNGTFLLRNPRHHSPGYQYWLVDKTSNTKYELRRSDWVPLMLYWFAKNRLPVTYDIARGSMLIPASLFYVLPGLVRFALTSLSPEWPEEFMTAQRLFLKVIMSRAEAEMLQHLYAPAIQVSYE